MRQTCLSLALCLLLAVTGDHLFAGTLHVGPGKPFDRIEDANANAKAGDTILVHAREDNAPYMGTAVYVTEADLTFRAVPSKKGGLVPVNGKGFDYSGRGIVPRAIFQFNKGADNCVLEGFELYGAAGESHNGAGVRINQANHITIRNCDIHHNDMGIMSNGSVREKTGANQVIEHCLIHDNGTTQQPGLNHNLYLGGTSASVRFCNVHSSLTGHNIKSRAHHTRVIYSYVHDAANREFDLVDAANTGVANSDAGLMGNIIVKATPCKGNKAVIHFGQDGGKPHSGTLYLIHNTIVTPYISPVVDLSETQARLKLVGNIICDGKGKQRNQVLVKARNGAQLHNVSGSANWLTSGFSLPQGSELHERSNILGQDDTDLFRKPDRHDYRLARRKGLVSREGSPFKSLRLPPVPGAPENTPNGELLRYQYRHPAAKEKRPREKRPELGAYGR